MEVEIQADRRAKVLPLSSFKEKTQDMVTLAAAHCRVYFATKSLYAEPDENKLAIVTWGMAWDDMQYDDYTSLGSSIIHLNVVY